MNFACQFCSSKNSKVYCRCLDCELFLCSQCDYLQHAPSGTLQELKVNSSHKRVRICEECEEQECATWCLNCEQFLCMPCNNRLHQKGARQKHRRQPNEDLAPELIKPAGSTYDKRSSCSSSVEPQQHSQGRESESSRKNSTDTDYFIEQQPQMQQTFDQSTFKRSDKLNSSYTQKSNQYGSKGGSQDYRGKVSQYQPGYHATASGNTRVSTHQRGNKEGCYSSGGSSSGSYHNHNTNYRNQDQYYSGGSGHYSSSRHGGNNKYKKGTGNYLGAQGGNSYSTATGQQSSSNAGAQQTDIIPPQYFDGDQVVIPVWQPLIKCEEKMQEMNILQKELFNLANKGELLIEIEAFVGILSDRLCITEDEGYSLIDLAEQQEIIHQTRRNFAKMKTLSFVSLQLDMTSHECLSWVLTSLRKDEMTPTERAIQSRIKEAFAFKISSPLWECILESLLTKDSSVHSSTKHRQVIINPQKSKVFIQSSNYHQTYSEYYNIQKYNHNQHQQQAKTSYIYQDKRGEHVIEFAIKEIEEDPSIGQMTKAIYLKDQEEWIGVDQNVEGIDYNLYDELKSFLQDYFCSSQEATTFEDEEEKWCSSIENALTRTTNNYIGPNQRHHLNPGYAEIDFDEVRAIPGGRYGCAQFVKICGPQNLKICSLGRLAQLVQFAVKEDVLRYHKTLLVWTTTVDKHKKLAEELQKESHQKAAIGAKLTIVKNALIEILAESKTGMSLAQLPLYLRRKLPFTLDLNELGFPKLKDLILSMSDKIKLELRGHNHPFAYLIKSGRYVHSSSNSDDFQSIPKSKNFIKTSQPHLSEDVNINRHLKNAMALNEVNIKNVLTAFINSMREVPLGIRSDELPRILSAKIGQELDFKSFGCHSLLEFIKKFVIPTIDIEIIASGPSENDSFIVRSKQFYMNCNYDLAKQQHIQGITKVLNNMAVQDTQMQPRQTNKAINRQDSESSSLNVSSQCYVPNHQSLYGGSTSANTSTQINISHIRFNTADTAEMQNNILPKQEIHQTLVTNNNPFTKPPLPPQSQNAMASLQSAQLYINQQNVSLQAASLKLGNSAYKTYPPVQQVPVNQNQQQAFIKHQQQLSNSTMNSGNSGVQMIPTQQQMQQHPVVNFNFRPNFFLSPGQLQYNKLGDQFSQLNNSQSPPMLHSRATSFNTNNNSAYGFGGHVQSSGNQLQSTTSKSASQDFSIQSSIMPMMTGGKPQPSSATPSGFITPQVSYSQGFNQNHQHHPLNFMHQNAFNNPSRSYFPVANSQNHPGSNNGQDSIFGSPIPRNYQNHNNNYETASMNQANYNYENSPPYDHDDGDGDQMYSDHNIKFIERLVCDDESDFKSAGCGTTGDGEDPFSGNVSMMQSPQLSSVGLRVPHSSLFTGLGGPGGLNQQKSKKTWSNDFMRSASSQYSSSSKSGQKALQQSSSAKSIENSTVIMEGGSSSSDEQQQHKRPSTVMEQRTEEDMEDMNASVLNYKWNHLMNPVGQSGANAAINNLFDTANTNDPLWSTTEDLFGGDQQ